jgi:UDP-N-acetylmuramate dehydrogenase
MKNCFADMSEIVVEHEPLAGYTSYRVGGLARWLARPRNLEELARLVGRCAGADVPVYTIGRGANLLVSDEGVDGMVIRLDAPAFCRVDWPDISWGSGHPTGRAGPVLAGAGADMYWLVRESVRRGLAGLEGLAGIPGCLGGVVRMNAGGKRGQIADVVGGLTVVDARGDIRRLAPAEAGFGYRRSSLAGMVICDVELELRPENPIEIRERLKDTWRSKSATQPMGELSAGCVFKNPPGGSSGALIDRAGLKGRTVGGARVSQVHANFIVVRPGVTAEDIFTLIGQVRREVARQFGVELELEIEVWGRRQVRVPAPAG